MPTFDSCNDSNETTYIDLQRPHAFFTNEDVVRGCVRVHPTERPNGIKIVFRGRCKMTLVEGSGKSKKIHKSTLELFSTSRLLFNSNTSRESYAILNRGTATDGNVELPFEFTFPTQVMMAPNDLYKPSPAFEHKAGHPLPTSMDYGSNSVEYALEVFVYKTTDWTPDKIVTLTLPFRPTAPWTASDTTDLVEFPKSPELYIIGHQLDPNNDQDPGLLTKLKWSTMFKYKHAIPGAKWRLTANCPYLLIAGKRVPISFSFYHIGHTPEIPEAPVVYVNQIGVKLTSMLMVRVPYQGMTGDRDTIRTYETVIINKVFVAGDEVMRDGLKLEEFGSLSLPPTVLPSFRTYGLRLMYRIKVVVEGHCAHQEFKFTALRDFCYIACDVQREGRNLPDAAVASGSRDVPLQSPREAAIEDQLPAYDPAPNYEEASSTGKEAIQ
ncbi:hypothetical protein SVAN01_09481 [Stagonosporopsis vannaccii]|nr:hypothetical protein SVAN01_09481 [Stagonosporopsis vannaccii]